MTGKYELSTGEKLFIGGVTLASWAALPTDVAVQADWANHPYLSAITVAGAAVVGVVGGALGFGFSTSYVIYSRLARNRRKIERAMRGMASGLEGEATESSETVRER
jgi:hypothetical protein